MISGHFVTVWSFRLAFLPVDYVGYSFVDIVLWRLYEYYMQRFHGTSYIHLVMCAIVRVISVISVILFLLGKDD